MRKHSHGAIRIFHGDSELLQHVVLRCSGQKTGSHFFWNSYRRPVRPDEQLSALIAETGNDHNGHAFTPKLLIAGDDRRNDRDKTHRSPYGHPARGRLFEAGLLACGSPHLFAFPEHQTPVDIEQALTAYSCGGSYGFAVRQRTIFPS